MGQHAISGLAVVVVLTFLALALAACSTSAQVAGAHQPAAIAAIPSEQAGTSEFHGAHIARDALRDRLPSES
jgi:hypothetical protein